MEKISEIPFYQLVHFVDEFQNLYSQGKGNGSALAGALDLHFHIRAGCSGIHPNLSIRRVQAGRFPGACWLASLAKMEDSRFRESNGAR